MVREKYKLNLKNPKWNQVTFGEKSFKGFGVKVWNNLPYHIKSSQNLEMFKSMIKQWNGSLCKCLIYGRWYIFILATFYSRKAFYWKLFATVKFVLEGHPFCGIYKYLLICQFSFWIKLQRNNLWNIRSPDIFRNISCGHVSV